MSAIDRIKDKSLPDITISYAKVEDKIISDHEYSLKFTRIDGVTWLYHVCTTRIYRYLGDDTYDEVLQRWLE